MYEKKFPESEVWIGTSKIAFTPDDWKISTMGITDNYTTTDVAKIKRDKLILN